MNDREEALDNMADYRSITRIKLMLSQLYKLRTMAEKGNQVALCIAIDLEEAMKSKKLTNRQQQCLYMKYIEKESNVYIADQLNICESAVRKHLEGALKRLRNILLGQT